MSLLPPKAIVTYGGLATLESGAGHFPISGWREIRLPAVEGAKGEAVFIGEPADARTDAGWPGKESDKKLIRELRKQIQELQDKNRELEEKKKLQSQRESRRHLAQTQNIAPLQRPAAPSNNSRVKIYAALLVLVLVILSGALCYWVASTHSASEIARLENENNRLKDRQERIKDIYFELRRKREQIDNDNDKGMGNPETPEMIRQALHDAISYAIKELEPLKD